MYRLHITQELWSLRERFTVTDDHGAPRYSVEGSLLQIPKQFRIMDPAGRPVAVVRKVFPTLLPRYILEIGGQKAAIIQQRLSLLRKRFEVKPIDSYSDIVIQGDYWNMNFEVSRQGRPIGKVGQKWLSLRDRFTIVIDDPQNELLMVSLVIAIDHVKRVEQTAAASASAG